MARKEVTTDDIKLDSPSVDLDKGPEALAIVEGASANDVAKLADGESFMNDKLELHLHEPTNPDNESPLVEVTVNGRYFVGRRGSTAVFPRYAVEVLARSKMMRVRTEKRMQADGSEQAIPLTSHSMSYPFSVLRDPAGDRGAAWLKNILSQPA